MPAKSKRLTADDWIKTGFKALSANGPEALKAEALAREIGSTKGSFYWHFKDVPDFKRRMAQAWEAEVLSTLAAAAEQGGTATQRLNRFDEVVTTSLSTSGTETAMRAWAKAEPIAREACAEVDKLRLNYLTAVLDNLGLSNPDFASIFYGAQIGMTQLPGGISRDALSTLVAALLALQEA